MSNKKDEAQCMGVCITGDNEEVLQSSFRECGYRSKAVLKENNDNFAVYSLGIKVLMWWSFYFRVSSKEDAFEVTQSSEIISPFEREEYKIVVKRSLTHMDYEFPETLNVVLYPNGLPKLPIASFSRLTEDEFAGFIEKEELEIKKALNPKTKKLVTVNPKASSSSK